MTPHRAQQGFTLVEVLLAAVLLGATMAAMGYAVANATALAEQQQLAAQGRYLLQDAITWVRSLARVDPSDATGFGMESGESVIAHVDDVDDLAALVETGPIDRAGVAADADWQRSWKVVSANLTNPANDVANGSTPLLRVEIAITWRGRPITAECLLLSRTP